LNDVPVALRSEHRKRGSRDIHDAEKIRLHLRTEVVLRNMLDRVHVCVAGVVDDDVQAAKRRGRDRHGGARCGRVRNVKCHGAHAIAVFDDEVAEVFGVACRGHEAIARREHGLREIAAKAA